MAERTAMDKIAETLQNILSGGGNAYNKKGGNVNLPEELQPKPKETVELTEEEKKFLDPTAEALFEQWKEWSRGVTKAETISQSRKQNWQALWEKPYQALTEPEKEVDRRNAKKLLERIRKLSGTDTAPQQEETTR